MHEPMTDRSKWTWVFVPILCVGFALALTSLVRAQNAAHSTSGATRLGYRDTEGRRATLGAPMDEVPQPLIDQLAPGGRLVIPVGGGFFQKLLLVEKQKDGRVVRRNIIDVAFVPMTGEAQKRGER